MGNSKVVGHCHICGDFGPLSEEHVPPQRAFNNMPFVEISFTQRLALGPDDVPDGRKRQGGIRFTSLCRQCNNDFGSWYARAFIEWCYQGMFILEKSGGNPRLVYAHDIYPLRIVKQLAVMFMAINSDRFRLSDTVRDLVPILKNKEAKGLPDNVRFYAYFNMQGKPRYTPKAGLYDIARRNMSVFSEITYPPFGYIMVLNGKPPNSRLFDITHFARSEYNERRTSYLDLPVLPTHLGIPGDYRELDDIYREEQRNIAEAIRQGIDPNTL